MLEVGRRRLQRRNSKEIGLRSVSQTFELGKNEPHPMAALAPLFQLYRHPGYDGLLRIDKPLQVIASNNGPHRPLA
jgi:hypothetical protein